MVNNWMLIIDFILTITQPICLYSSAQLCNYLYLHIFFSSSVSSERFLLSLVILSYFFLHYLFYYFILLWPLWPYFTLMNYFLPEEILRIPVPWIVCCYLMLLNHCCFIFQLFHYPLHISLIFQNLNSTFVSEGEQNILPKKRCHFGILNIF